MIECRAIVTKVCVFGTLAADCLHLARRGIPPRDLNSLRVIRFRVRSFMHSYFVACVALGTPTISRSILAIRLGEDRNSYIPCSTSLASAQAYLCLPLGVYARVTFA